MNPVIEIMCEGEKVCLGAFAIRGRTGGLRGYRTAGITTRVVLQQRSSVIDREGNRLFVGGRGIPNSDDLKETQEKKADEEKGDDVANFTKNTASAEKQRADALSTDSDSRQKGKSAILTLEGMGPLSKVRKEVCYGEWAKEKMNKVPTTSDSGQSANTEGIMKDTAVLHRDMTRNRQPRRKIGKSREHLTKSHSLGFGQAQKEMGKHGSLGMGSLMGQGQVAVIKKINSWAQGPGPSYGVQFQNRTKRLFLGDHGLGFEQA